MALTKREIIKSIYENMDVPRHECSRIVESVFEIIKEELENGNMVKISGFGQWNVRQKRARKGRNPQTGEAMIIGERKVVTFKASQVLRDGFNGDKS
ncbi:MAG: Integration host factor subunit alpha [Syntrophus sp. SKADARSKE-3]|nr:Integration host factor subunit alpha [Syntrophus sp. SKADARSKE-3]